MKKILNISLLLLIVTYCFPQKTIIKGYVKDINTLSPIKDVNIQIEGYPRGTTSNDSGFFSFSSNSNNIRLIATHVSYKKQFYTNIRKNKEIEILLTPQINELKEFTINANPIQSITKKLPIYVIDYLLIDNKILLLAYNRKKITDTRLLLIDHDANILLEKKIGKAEELYRDCFEDIYYLNKKEAVKIEIKPTEIAIIQTIAINDFYAYNKAIDFKINDNIFYHTFHYQNFIMKLHCINLYDEENERRTILTLTDSSKIDIFESEFNFFYYAKRAQQYGLSVTSVYKNLDVLRNYQSLDWVDIHGRFSPLKATVINIMDKICLFNTITNTIETYNTEGKIISKSEAKFINDKKYTGKIIKDENGKALYAVYKEGSSISLKEVDVISGNLKPSINIPDFPFIENIKVASNKVYFLYKKTINEELKQLYTLQI
ncbi:MAG: carboxypeptidase-like regulatory domain-containing protein [Bacteroidetes bacterium]|nr:carboxypeptidase-like regulatory domain-containing protein [Bacteroidota bacterium]